MKRAASLLVATALVVAAAPALADDPVAAASAASMDTVHLRNGGMYRGRVTEIVPTDHVTILVEGGGSKQVSWSEIDRVVVASTPAPPPPVTSTGMSGYQVGARVIPQGTAPTPAPMNGPKIRVHITSPTPVVLYRRPQGSTAWSQACTSPCNEQLPLGDSYRVVGNGVPQSSEFTLQGSPGGTVDLKVDGQSTGGMVLGGTVAGIGSLIGYVGFLAVLVSVGNGRSSRNEDARNGGLVAMGLGAAATVGGILIFLASAKTDVAQTPSGGSSARPNDAWKRLPTWRTAEASAAPAQFPVLFSGRF